MLSAQDGKELLLLARRSIEERLRRSREHVPPPPGAALQEPAGAFVTIRTHPDGGLRGCIGRLEAEAPAWEMVRAMEWS